MNFLEKIVGQKKEAVERAKEILTLNELTSLVSDVKPRNDLKKALIRQQDEPVRVIAEIKRASPSKGVIAGEIDPAVVARDYRLGKASAISVLTEASFFNGSTGDFHAVREAVPDISLLRKDFIIDEYQIYESLLIGADAILLIVAVLGKERVKGFLTAARDCGLNALVEVHSEEELETALSAGAEIVGVNNRNLVTFEVSPKVSEELSERIPKGIVSVSESGISDTHGIRVAFELGYHAVLIGEHLMRTEDRVSELRKLTSFASYANAKR